MNCDILTFIFNEKMYEFDSVFHSIWKLWQTEYGFVNAKINWFVIGSLFWNMCAPKTGFFPRKIWHWFTFEMGVYYNGWDCSRLREPSGNSLTKIVFIVFDIFFLFFLKWPIERFSCAATWRTSIVATQSSSRPRTAVRRSSLIWTRKQITNVSRLRFPHRLKKVEN